MDKEILQDIGERFMYVKHYLFYEKQSFRESWKDLLLTEKILLSIFLIFDLIVLVLFGAITLMSTDKLRAGVLLSFVWLFMFPGILLLVSVIEKSFWIKLCDTYIVRHGDCIACVKNKKISYDEAKYIIVGNVGPFIVPPKTSPEWYHKKFGNYINVVGENLEILFTVRYGVDIMKILSVKCICAKTLDIEQYSVICKEKAYISEEFQREEQKIVDQYQGRI